MVSVKVIDELKEVAGGVESKNYSITFILSYKQRGNQNICSAVLSGTDLDNGTHYKWLNEEMPLDKKFIIEVGENEYQQISEPKSVSREADSGLVDQEKPKYYFRLKRELEEKGLI